jgi:hypothetical protein
MRRIANRFFNIAKIPVVMAVCFAFTLFLVGQRVYIMKIGDDITRLKDELRIVRSQNDELEMQITTIVEADTLEKIAEEEFGLRAATFGDVVQLEEPMHQTEGAGDGAFFKVRMAAAKTWNQLVLGAFKLGDYEISGSI